MGVWTLKVSLGVFNGDCDPSVIIVTVVVVVAGTAGTMGLAVYWGGNSGFSVSLSPAAYHRSRDTRIPSRSPPLNQSYRRPPHRCHTQHHPSRHKFPSTAPAATPNYQSRQLPRRSFVSFRACHCRPESDAICRWEGGSKWLSMLIGHQRRR